MVQKLSLIIQSEFENVRLVGASIRGLCDGVLRNVNASEIEMCVVEGVNNAIEHAYSGRSDGIVSVDVELVPDLVSISIIDRGRTAPDDLLSRAVEPEEPDLDDLEGLPEGGFGFPLMHVCMDDLSYASAGGSNVLTMKKRLPPTKSAA